MKKGCLAQTMQYRKARERKQGGRKDEKDYQEDKKGEHNFSKEGIVALRWKINVCDC